MGDRRPILIVALLPFLAAMAAYSFTMAPSIYPGDSPEFTTASYVLGVPHPPGYAHYVILGKIAELLPAGNVAFRLNLLSGLGAAAAVSALSLSVFRLTGNPFAAIVGGLLLAFSRDFWAQSGSAEVYTLQVALLFLILLVSIRPGGALPEDAGPGADRGAKAALFSAAFLFGFTLGFHYFILFALPGGLCLFARRMGGKPLFAAFLPATGFAVAGWCLFLLLPLRSASVPLLDWGGTRDLHNFLVHIFWSQYSGRPSLSFSFARLAGRIGDLGELLRSQWPGPFWLFLPPGVLFLRRNPGTGLLPAALLLSIVPAAATLLLLNDPSREIFLGISSNKFLTTCAVLAWIAALGLAEVWRWISDRARSAGGDPLRTAALRILALVFLALPAAAAWRNLGFADRSGSLQLHAYGLNLLDPLPPRSAVVTEYDVPTFPLLYFRAVEDYRPDLAFFGRTGILFGKEYDAALAWKDVIRQEKARRRIDDELARRFPRRIFFSNQAAPYAPGGDAPSVPFGLLYAPGGAAPDAAPEPWGVRSIAAVFAGNPASLDHRNRELVSDMYRMSAERKAAEGRLEEADRDLRASVDSAPGYYWAQFYAGVLRQRYWKDAAASEALLRRAAEIIPSETTFNQLGILRYGEGDVEGAAAWFRRALTVEPDYAPALKNLGTCGIDLGDLPAAEAALERASALDPEDPANWIRLGQVRGNRKKFAEAEASFSRAIDLSPADGEIRVLRAISLLGQGKRREAIADVSEAARLAPGRKEYRDLLLRLSGEPGG